MEGRPSGRPFLSPDRPLAPQKEWVFCTPSHAALTSATGLVARDRKAGDRSGRNDGIYADLPTDLQFEALNKGGLDCISRIDVFLKVSSQQTNVYLK